MKTIGIAVLCCSFSYAADMTGTKAPPLAAPAALGEAPSLPQLPARVRAPRTRVSLDFTVPDNIVVAKARAEILVKELDSADHEAAAFLQIAEELAELSQAFVGVDAQKAVELEAAAERAKALYERKQATGKAAARAKSLAELLMARSYDTDEAREYLDEMQDLAKIHAQDPQVRRPIASSLLAVLKEPSSNAGMIASALEKIPAPGAELGFVLNGLMERAYHTQDTAQAWRLVEAVEKLAIESKDARSMGLAYALIQREKGHAKNEDYRARLEESLARVTQAAGGKILLPYVSPVPGKAVLKGKSTVSFWSSWAASFKARWTGFWKTVIAPPQAMKQWLLQLKDGAKDSAATTFFGLALLGGSIAGLSFSRLPVLGIAGLSLLIADIYRKAFEDPYGNYDDGFPNLIAAFFQSALISGLFFAVGFGLPAVGPLTLAGLLGAGVIMRTMANWGVAHRITGQSFAYNALIGGLAYFLLAGLSLIRAYYGI